MQGFRPPHDILVGVLGALAFLGGWLWLLRKSKQGTRLIEAPTLGILNLLGPAGTAWAVEDRKALSHLFPTIRESDAEPPRCDVLFVYGDVSRSGAIARSTRRLRELVRDAKAEIVVVASPNAAEDYYEAARPAGFGSANLVMTLDRKGSALGAFFVQLFEKMHAGTPMPSAWVEMQPQAPSAVRDDFPDLICLMERGQLAFFDAAIASALLERRRAA